MRNVYRIIVLIIAISISQEVEITTFEPPNSTVPIHYEEVTSNQTSVRPSLNSTSDEILVTTTDYVKPQTVLEYKPLKPFHQPLPINQVVPPGKPLPDSTERHEIKPTKSPIQTLPQDLVDRFPELTTLNKRISTPNKQPQTTTDKYVKPSIVLGYKPITSFYHPHPVTLAQIIPPGKPLPDGSAGGYETTQGASPETTLRPELVSRKTTTTKTTQSRKTKLPFYVSRKTTTPKVSTTKETTVKPITVLEYVPSTSFYYPRPSTIPQLIPPGKPWPASAEDYPTTKVSSSATTPVANLDDSSPEMVSKKPTTIVDSQTILEYKPITSFHHPNPVTVAQIVPPGKPWPASAEDYQTTIRSPTTTTSPPIVEDSFPQTVSKKTTTRKTPPSPVTDKTTKYVESQTILEYKPITSSYHPHPVTIAQLIPPGTPWPASAEETKTDPPTAQTSSQTLAPNLIDRFPELVSIKTTTKKSSTHKPTVASTTPTTPSSSTRIILTYKPQRPWYLPRPGVTVGPIIPPGKPWPASPSGYPSFSVTTNRPWTKESVDKDAGNNELSLEYYKPDELQSLKEERSLEPNALQYYGPSVTAPPRLYNNAMTPFTSGTQKTTISDIVDILKEVHNITLVSGNAVPKPSHLLPFDLDKGPPVGSPVVRRPSSHGNQQRNQPPVEVYDGSLIASQNRERIFPNPKFVPQH